MGATDAIALDWQRRLSLDEYHRMVAAGVFDEDEPLELLWGVLVATSPQGPRHAYAVQQLDALLQAAAGAEHRVRTQMPLTLAGAGSEPEPDLAVVPAAAISRDHHPGTAVLVVEVSMDSLDKDRAKASLYARAAIPEYWILNLRDEQLEVHRDPHPDAGAYRSTSFLHRGEEAVPETLPAARVPLDELL